MDARPGEMAITLDHILRPLVLSPPWEWNDRVICAIIQWLTLSGTTHFQVRTLEGALHDEFDPKRRLHGWARSGMTMDGEDFIDLAKVSKRVPGKTPAQVNNPSRGSL